MVKPNRFVKIVTDQENVTNICSRCGFQLVKEENNQRNLLINSSMFCSKCKVFYFSFKSEDKE